MGEYAFAALPHVPFTGFVSVHEAIVPPFVPLQFHK